MVEFMMNGLVFILIGLELPSAIRALAGESIARLVTDALLISISIILIRIGWVFAASYLPRLLNRRLRARDPLPSWRHVAIVAWTGMRGVVSLAAALAIPENIQDGKPFPGRDPILFLTFVVIAATLVFQGISLPFLIRALGVKDDRGAEREEREARIRANQAAFDRLCDLEKELDPGELETLSRLRIEYEDRLRQLESYDPEDDDGALRIFSTAYDRLSKEALGAERQAILTLRNQNVINDEVLRNIQRDIDFAEARLQHQR
jgi:CPA1 family monovalent cation:H+ antiporter